MCGLFVGQASNAAHLFSPAVVPSQQLGTLDLDDLIVRSQRVNVNFALLNQLRNSPSSRVELNVFPDTTLDVVINRTVNRAATTFTLIGAIEDEPGSSVFLSINQNVLVGEVRTAASEHYQIEYVRGGVHEVREIDDSQYPPCGGGVPVVLPPGPSASALSESADDGSQFDVLVVYTPAARVSAGGTSAIEASVNLAVDQTNSAFANSLIAPRVRLLFQQEIAYTEVDSSTDLQNLRGTSDGFMDEVHALRDLLGADMVSLILNTTGVCGRAFIMSTLSLSSSFASFAFGIVNRTCLANLTFAHELGHNMGSLHAVGDGGLTRAHPVLFPYSYGWRFNSDQDRTIMAFAPGIQRLHFSNPDVTFNGFPTGVPIGDPDQAHNAQSINDAANTVANWRLEAVLPACLDGVDNDGDGLIDFPDDPGCDDAFDTSESSAALPPLLVPTLHPLLIMLSAALLLGTGFSMLPRNLDGGEVRE